MKNIIIIIIAGLVICFSFILFLKGNEKLFGIDANQRICTGYNEVIKSKVQGVVEKAFIDKENHNFKKIIIDDKGQINVLFLDFDESGLFEYLEKGDSIMKPANTNLVQVFRGIQPKQFKLDYGCVQ